MIFKNQSVIIFQSPFQAFLFKKYCDDLFVDGTFYVAPCNDISIVIPWLLLLNGAYLALHSKYHWFESYLLPFGINIYLVINFFIHLNF